MLLNFSCEEIERGQNPPIILGHAGEGFGSMVNNYPANSEFSVRHALADGALGIEVDLQMSSDSVFVLFHDSELERSTEGYGAVHEQEWSYLAELSYTNVPSSLSKKTGILTAKELMKICSEYPSCKWISLHVKPQGYLSDSTSARSFAKQLKEFIEQNRQFHFLIETNVEGQIKLFREVGVPARLFWLGKYDRDIRQFLIENDIDGLSVPFKLVSPENVRTLHLDGKKVMVYNIRIRRDIVESLELGADLIQTDNVPLTLEYFWP